MSFFRVVTIIGVGISAIGLIKHFEGSKAATTAANGPATFANDETKFKAIYQRSSPR